MSKELLTAILEACNDFHTFLTVDLQGESLATRVENRRQKLVLSTSDIITRIRSSHVSVRPRLYTPSTNGDKSAPAVGKKPAPKPPAPTPQEEQEMYVECEGQEQPEDYLTFIAKTSEENEEQETYEAMTADEPLDLYEDPVQGVTSPPGSSSPHPSSHPPLSQNEDIQQDMYEEPVISPAPPLGGPTPTPPPSAENSGSSAVYARTHLQVPPANAPPSETATEWMYDVTKKDEKKTKVSQLENILCKGNLEKLGGKSKKTWQVRFCVLSGPFMYFYEKESSKIYRNRITLPMYTVQEAPEHTNAKKRHFAFKLTHTDTSGLKKDYFFRSSKKESCDTWLQSIKTTNERTSLNSQQQGNTQQPAGTTSTTPAGSGGAGPDGQLELYEPIEPIEEMASDEEDETGAQEDYIDIQPPPPDQEEYIDVPSPQPQEGDEIQEEYEDTSQFLATPTPPPIPPPPPSSSQSSRPPPSTHRPDPHVDTDKIYTAAPKGIDLRHVYVALWDFVGSKSDELSVQRGDLVHVVDPDPGASWWAGEGLDSDAAAKSGAFGFLPSSYFMAAFEEVAE